MSRLTKREWRKVMLIKKPFKKIKKFIKNKNCKKTNLFKIWFLDNTTEVRNSDNQVVMSSKINDR